MYYEESSMTLGEAIQLKADHERLLQAVRAIYYVGMWHTPVMTDDAADILWRQLRDAAGFESGGTS